MPSPSDIHHCKLCGSTTKRHAKKGYCSKHQVLCIGGTGKTESGREVDTPHDDDPWTHYKTEECSKCAGVLSRIKEIACEGVGSAKMKSGEVVDIEHEKSFHLEGEKCNTCETRRSEIEHTFVEPTYPDDTTDDTSSKRAAAAQAPNLVDLPNIQQLDPLVVRILGQNPGKLTLQGTNTFLIGRVAPYILIDTGEGKPEYISQLEIQLDASPSSTEACPISDIILTHKYFDHHGGGLANVLGHLSMRRVAGGSWTPPRVHIHPLSQGASDQSLEKTIAALQDGTYTPHNDSPFFPLSDESKLRTQDGSAELEVIHTAGHTTDSICLVLFSLSSPQPKPEALFTADIVLGASAGVFENLSAYMASLKRLVALPIWPVHLHPGHGPSIPPESAKAHVQAYISHREARENQIISVLKGEEGKKGTSITVGEIVKTLYAKHPEKSWAAAAQGVTLHLKKLESEGRVKQVGSGSSPPNEELKGERMEVLGTAEMADEWEWKEDDKP